MSVVAPPRPPARRTRSQVQTLILFIGFWAVIVWGLNAFSDRYGYQFGPSAGAILSLVFASIVALAGPQLGLRRSAAFIVLVPIVGAGIMFLVVWRVASLPDRYWTGSLFPRRWTIGWTILALAGVGLFAVSIASTPWWTVQPQSREAAIANELRRGGTMNGSPVRERRSLMTFRRGVRTLVVEEIILQAGREFDIFWVRPGTRKSDARWVLEREGNLARNWTCFSGDPDPFCVLRTHERAASVEVTFHNQARVTGVAVDGVGLVWIGPNAQIKSWQSFDATGALLETKS